MDLVLKLRELRRVSGLSQKDVAVRAGIGEKTISSFETGERIGSMKVTQLRKLLSVYGVTEREFFGNALETRLTPCETQAEHLEVLADLSLLPSEVQGVLLEKFTLMIAAAASAVSIRNTHHIADSRRDWQLLTSRN